MKEIYFNKNELILKIDGIKQPLIFNIGVLISGEKEYGGLTAIIKHLVTIEGSIFFSKEIINAAIRKYNREYNGNEKPIDVNEIYTIINELRDLSNLSFFIYNTYLSSQPATTNSSEERLSNKEPSTAGFIVMGVAKLGFSKAEIMEMTVKELSEYINFYMESIGIKKDEVKVPKGATVQGIGKAEDILRLLR